MSALTSEIGRAFAEVLRAEVPFDRLRAVAEEERGYSPELWRALAQGGWLQIGLRNADDPLSFTDVLSACEQVGVSPVPGPYTLTTAYVAPVVEHAFPEMAADVVEGTLLVSAIVPSVRWEGGLQLVRPVAGSSNGAVVLRGAHYGVPFGESAAYLLFTGVDEQHVPFVARVPTDSSSVTIRPDAALDLSCPTATVVLESVRVGVDDIARGPKLGALVERHVLLQLLAMSAESLGGVCEVVRQTVEYVGNRRQFGVPIGSFQALKHSLADVHTAYELGAAAAYDGAERLEADASSMTAAAVLAVRLHTARAFTRACEVAIQCHGGAGFTWEQGLHYWYRSALRLSAASTGVVEVRAALTEAVPSLV